MYQNYTKGINMNSVMHEWDLHLCRWELIFIFGVHPAP